MNKRGIKMLKEFNFSTAKKASEVPALQRLKKAHQRSTQTEDRLLDDDVIDWLSNQDISTRKTVNARIREIMADSHT